MKARKKPIVIECWQFSAVPREAQEIPGWLSTAMLKNTGEFGAVWFQHGKVYVQSKEGLVTGPLGCYVMQGLQKELYLCDKTIFEMTYEVVEEKANG